MNPQGEDKAPVEPIAVVGIGCRLPGDVGTPNAFWDLLLEGRDGIIDVPADRWNLSAYHDRVPGHRGKIVTRRGGFVGDLDRFDAAAFGISPREAEMMDPQQRLLLEVAWESLEDAGLIARELAGTPTGVFVGISNIDYSIIQSRDARNANAHSGTGIALSIAANRISYVFDFRGPSIAIDTACSSSLVAIHLACRSLWSGESRVAIAGGVNRIIDPSVSVGFSLATMLAPDGRCKAFDARADGFVRAEGAGLLVLKPLSAARLDRDRVYAVIRATGVNQDGHTVGIALPSGEAQKALIAEVYGRAGIEPHEVGYVEAHGTGTAAGDPIEADAIGTILGRGRTGGDRCLIGSVKTNVGHLEPASGVTGAIKVALALQHGIIPGQRNFESPNPNIDFEALKLEVVTAATPFRTPGTKRAGINSFGFGGTNAHALFEEAPRGEERTEAPPERTQPVLFPLSAKSAGALVGLATALSARLATSEPPSFDDLLYTAALRRDHLPFRAGLVARSCAELSTELDAFLASGGAGLKRAASKRSRIVFVCSGMGPQWWGMGRELLQSSPVFREAIERCDAHFEKLSGWSLVAAMLADESDSKMNRTEVSQPTNFALQVGLAALWASWGIEPDAVIGHSAGEVASIYLAGAMSLPEAIRVVHFRSSLQQRTAGRGRLAAAGLSVEEAEKLVAEHEGAISIAAVNTRTLLSLAGSEAALDALGKRLEAEGRYWKMLYGDVPFHSAAMDPIEAPLREALDALMLDRAKLPLVSTVTGTFVEGPELDATYWWKNVRDPVRFADAIGVLLAEGYETFVELSPHPVLASAIAEAAAGAGARAAAAVAFASQKRGEASFTTLLGTLGRLYASGAPIRWDAFVQGRGRLSPLPPYAWQRERFWREHEDARQFRVGHHVHPLLGRPYRSASPVWECELDLGRLPYLSDHRVQAIPVLPGAAYLEMALAAAREHEGSLPALESIVLLRPIVLDENEGVTVQVSLAPETKSFAIHSRPSVEGAAWTVHATGSYRPTSGEEAPRRESIEALLANSQRELVAADCYPAFERYGLTYGPAFQGIERLHFVADAVLGRIRLPVAAGHDDGYVLHPALLDACFQSAICAIFAPGTALPQHDNAFVVAGIDAVTVFGVVPTDVWSHVRIVDVSSTRIVAHVRILDASGRVVAEIRGLRCQTLERSASGEDVTIAETLYEPRWRRKAIEVEGAPPLSAAFLPSPSALAAALGPESARLTVELDRDRYYREFFPAQDRVVSGILRDALVALGLDFTSDAKFTSDDLAARAGVVPEYRRMLDLVLEATLQDDLLARDGDGFRVTEIGRVPIDTGAAWTHLIRLFPDHRSEWTLLRRVEVGLVGVLRGKIDAVDLLFKGTQLGGAESFYQDSPTFQIYNQLTARLAKALAVATPGGRALRVLEIGAGSGGTTSFVLPTLSPSSTDYTFTDISRLFLAEAEEKFGAYPFVSYQTLDIERDPRAQGFTPESFDVVLASDSLHATADLGRTLDHVKSLLAPGGLLVLLELANAPRALHLCFGMLKGWWLFDDGLRSRGPLLDIAGWRKVLSGRGFADVSFIGDTAAPDEAAQNVIVARRETPHPVPTAGVMPVAEPRRVVLFADESGVAAKLSNELRNAGATCTVVREGETFAQTDASQFVIRPSSRDDIAALFEALEGTGETTDVVHLFGGDVSPNETSDLAAFDTGQRRGALSFLALAQVLLDRTSGPRLWLVTRGAQVVFDGEPLHAPSQTASWGLRRVLGAEHQDTKSYAVDIGANPGDLELGALRDEILHHGDEDEIALRQDARYVGRLFPSPEAALPTDTDASASDACRLMSNQPGRLDALHLQRVERRAPARGEVEVAVAAAALNFRDVMKALGVYPTEGDEELTLGDECAGTVVRVGEGVTHVAVGEDVVCVTVSCFSSFVTVPEARVFKKPARVPYSAAAALPTVFATAEYALHDLARMKKGERVLIHAAAGGVGLAAIQLAHAAGLEVFATAGSEAKRAYLAALGVKHIYDSRTLAFADRILEATGGAGVDIVLNSLAGDALRKSLSILAPYGRFLEIGKRDIYGDTKLGMRPFRKNISFFAIDLGRLIEERPEESRELFTRVLRRFDGDAVQPLPCRTYPANEALAAFREMAQGKHIGKIVLSMRGARAERADSPPSFRADATYLISGGLGGFGLLVAEWMVEHGARHLALVGRSGAVTPEAQAGVARLRHAGARVEVMKVDVADAKALRRVLDAIATSMPPLRGVSHAAMAMDDVDIPRLTEERWNHVFRAKALGGWNLHLQTLDQELDFFHLFSSFTAIIGTTGQAAYSAGNAVLDGLARHRAALGKPALSINWGPLGDVGFVAERKSVKANVLELGAALLSNRQVLAAIASLSRQHRAQVGMAEIDWAKWSQSDPKTSALPRFSPVFHGKTRRKSEKGAQARALRSRLQSSPVEERTAIMIAHLAEIVAAVLGTTGEVDLDAPITQLGFDSLMAVELNTRIRNDTGVALATINLMRGPSVTHLAGTLVEKLFPAAPTAS